MKLKRITKKIILYFFIITLFLLNSISNADVGDFETYSSGSSGSSGSSWSSSDYSSSHYSSSWNDRDYDYGRNNKYNNNKDSNIWGIILFVGIIVIIIIRVADKRRINSYHQYNNMMAEEPKKDEKSIINQIKEIDPLFNEDEFNSWVRDLFVKLQYAWSDREWSKMRAFETKELYEQHASQLERYKINRQINKIERVSVNSVKYLNFEQTGDKDVLSVVLSSKMIDYIIDEGTGQVIKGDRNTYKFNNYKLTFIRKKGIKTKPGDKKLNVTNCPNCGAPTEITSTGKCEYCGSIITTGEHDWVLSNLERYNYE